MSGTGRTIRSVRGVLQNASGAVAARHPEWFVDAAMAGCLNPSDAVVITGFWRSGTTWLLQTMARALGGKSVMEPLNLKIPGYRKIARQIGGRAGKAVPFMPYVPSGTEMSSALHAHLQKGLTGGLPGIFVRGARFGNRDLEHKDSSTVLRACHRVRDAFRTPVVCKFTRAHLLLPALHQTFNLTAVLHLRRDPRAVVASLKRKGWSWPRQISLYDLLLAPGDGRRQFFDQWRDEIHRVDEQPFVARVAAYWTLTERFVEQLPSHSRRIDLSYESLCRGQAEYLSEKVAAVLDLRVHSDHLRGDSVSVGTRRSGIEVEKRIHGWRRDLSTEEIGLVEEVVAKFGTKNILKNLE